MRLLVGRAKMFKIFSLNDFEGSSKFSMFEKEVKLLSSLRHPNILEFYGATVFTDRIGYLCEWKS